MLKRAHFEDLFNILFVFDKYIEFQHILFFIIISLLDLNSLDRLHLFEQKDKIFILNKKRR